MNDAGARLTDGEPQRKGRGCLLNGLLVIGIVFLPPLFVWFLLKRGTPFWAKALGFGWTSLWVLMAILSAISPTPPVTGPSTEGPGREESREPVSQEPREEQPEPSRADEAMRIHQAVLAAVATCDAAGAQVADIAGRLGEGASVVDGYRAAEHARGVCWDASSTVGRISIPSDMRDSYREPIDTCRSAYQLKSAVHMRMAEAFDDIGGMRPSELAAMEDLSQGAQAEQLRCVAQLLQAGVAEGATMEQLTAEAET